MDHRDQQRHLGGKFKKRPGAKLFVPAVPKPDQSEGKKQSNFALWVKRASQGK